jgi:hypothetical protein
MYGGRKVKEGTVLKVTKFNKLYIYAELGGCTLRLLRKRDAEYIEEIR